MYFKGNGPAAQTMRLPVTLSHNKTEQKYTHGDSRAPLSVFVASRAEQIAEQSAEFSTAVIPCRTWRSPFSQHDSAVQIGAILEPSPLDYESRNKESSYINIQCKKNKQKRLATAKGRKQLTPAHSCQSQHTERDE